MTISLILATLAVAQTAPLAPVARPLQYWRPVQDKNFYLLGLMEHDPKLARAIAAEPTLAKLAEDKRQAVKTAFESTTFGKIDAIATLKFTPEESETVSQALTRLYNSNSAIHQLADRTLPQTGAYYRDRAFTGSDLLVQAWKECSQGINDVIDVYALQTKKARTPSIDSPFYIAGKSPLYGAMIKTMLGALAEGENDHRLFFQPSEMFACQVMEAHMRDEAGRLEPMEDSENKAAFRRARRIDWTKYDRCAILVPGLGPEEPEVQLSPAAKAVLSVAAKRWRDGAAPFIVTSGGFVHPSQTPFCEAIEMKRSLMRDFGVPEDAILVDPHARHTTTNMRNTARLVFRYGLAFDKPLLVVTNTYQATDICDGAFLKRCQGVFGYQPATNYRRLGPFDVECRLTLDSLSIDPGDPLDP